jgi:hypothetical protein
MANSSQEFNNCMPKSKNEPITLVKLEETNVKSRQSKARKTLGIIYLGGGDVALLQSREDFRVQRTLTKIFTFTSFQKYKSLKIILYGDFWRTSFPCC